MYKKFIEMHVKTSMQYRLNMLFVSFSQLLISISEIIGIVLLFAKFNSVKEWDIYTVLLTTGIILTTFSFSECFFRGYDTFSKLIRSGDLDRILVRPRGINFQIICSNVQFTKFSRIILGLCTMIYALIKLNIVWSIGKVLLILFMFISAVTIIVGLFMISAGITIFSIQNLEVLNIITNGMKEVAQYPVNVFGKWFKSIFTYIIPIACFNLLPLSYLLDLAFVPNWLSLISPILGMLYIIPCILFFNWSLKKYASTGS